jgi:hypothetical protein
MQLLAALKHLSLMAALASSSLANATTQNFTFTECLSGCSGSVASVANLSITSISNGLSFRLTNTGPSGSFISDFYTTGAYGIASNFLEQSISNYTFSPTVHEKTVTSSNGYNYNFSYPTGENKDRFVSGDTAAWEITGENLSFGSLTSPLRMMVHVQALSGGASEKIGAIGAVAAVPEPETYAMFLVGLGIMGAVARRNTKN